jgi:hypothetical protein
MMSIIVPSEYREVKLDYRKVGPKMIDLLAKRIELYKELRALDQELLRRNGEEVRE